MKTIIKYVVLIIVLAVTGYVSAVTYNTLNPKKIYEEKTVTVVVEGTSTAPVLARIAKCESGDSQFASSGQVVVHVNNDGTYDMGAYQINSIWNAQATKLGFNLANEKDNRAFAKWLYENKGTSAWSASVSCWNK